MTKIKNTKKGMAKKTLSMSLVVAMLATSNVPVWAAEFSDGENVTEFSSEADVSETPVVVDDANVSVATTAASTITKTSHADYTIEWDMPGSEDSAWPEYTYTGDEFRPSIKKITTVTNGKEHNSSDYQLSWANNTNAGTATLTVSFTAAARVADTELPAKLAIQYTIKKADFSKATVVASKTPSYAVATDEKAAVRDVGITVTLGGKTLTEWDSNLNPEGQYNIDAATDLTTVGSGKGKIVIAPYDTANYSGNVTLTTDVNRKDINELYIAPIADVIFDKTPKEPSLIVKYNKDASANIVATNNYEVTYSDNILPGTATVHIKGINNYTGTKDVTFNIKAATTSLDGLKTLIGTSSVDYTGSEINYVKSAYVSTGADATLYSINRDFTVEYLTQHKNAGKCRVKVIGAGVYAGQSWRSCKESKW